MNKITWKALKKDGTFVSQYKDNQYTNFIDVKKDDWICFSLHNQNNNSNYAVDLMNGFFLLNGCSVIPSIQNDIYDIPCISKEKFNYSNTLFWYNQMISQLNTNNRDTVCSNVYFGYTLYTDIPFCSNHHNGKVVVVRPMIRINCLNNGVSFSTAYKFEYIDEITKQKKVIIG